MPLLHAIGVTNTQKSFSIGFCFMSGTKEQDYLFPLQILTQLGANPKFIVTDAEEALHNAMQRVWPEVPACFADGTLIRLLWRIARSISITEEEWQTFYSGWYTVFNSPDEQAFDDNWREFRTKYGTGTTLEVVNYLEQQWLRAGRKERCVKAWIDRYMHLGQTATSR
jgi:Rad3-related DNA helicase